MLGSTKKLGDDWAVWLVNDYYFPVVVHQGVPFIEGTLVETVRGLEGKEVGLGSTVSILVRARLGVRSCHS